MVYYDEYDYDYEDEDYSIDNVEYVQCYCEGHCPFGDDKGICEIPKPGGKCFASTSLEVDEDGDESALTSYGCLEDEQMATLQCKGTLVPHLNKQNIHCCDDADFCNKDLYPVYITEQKLPIVAITSSIVSALIVVLIIFVIYCKYRKKYTNTECDSEKNDKGEAIDDDKNDFGDFTNIIDVSVGSGSGFPVMVQRTIAKQIELQKVIGRGRYGEVWLANWRSGVVAAKLFPSTQEQSWLRETEIYRTILIKHEHILGFIGSDIKGTGGWTQLLLITEYHKNGSLFDYLQNNTLHIDLLLSMSMGIAKGLSYLHTEIVGVPGKAPIAHRDIKSKNILVKQNLDCCIADFGLAVKYNNLTKTVDHPPIDRSGTKRYMAPEILSNTMNLENFDSYKMADIYAFGLVLWELSRRCDVDEHKALDYEIPYLNLVSTDPEFNEMQNVVCSEKMRPSIPKFWNDNKVMQILLKLIQEMWHENPEVRLTALRVKKTLQKLIMKSDVNLYASSGSELDS